MDKTEDAALQRVLVVDDEPDSVEVVKMVLIAAGAEVFEASNGKDAFELVKKIAPTLILTDISMPEVDGWQFIKYLRAYGVSENIPIIALTAHAMVGDEEQVLAAGFDGYMSKPLNMFNLLEDIKHCIQQKEEKLRSGQKALSL